jgi:hypothetical protein
MATPGCVFCGKKMNERNALTGWAGLCTVTDSTMKKAAASRLCDSLFHGCNTFFSAGRWGFLSTSLCFFPAISTTEFRLLSAIARITADIA